MAELVSMIEERKARTPHRKSFSALLQLGPCLVQGISFMLQSLRLWADPCCAGVLYPSLSFHTLEAINQESALVAGGRGSSSIPSFSISDFLLIHLFLARRSLDVASPLPEDGGSSAEQEGLPLQTAQQSGTLLPQIVF
mgnify:CR=1 FL=1